MCLEETKQKCITQKIQRSIYINYTPGNPKQNKMGMALKILEKIDSQARKTLMERSS